uniref:Coenzyme F420:L-glutamate ligase n=1 Tax=Candidatus Methanogaster sp. ANME-2c ERB4 TaxID=2759911 RepID=A0A7G9YPQ5_9EURY|nr:coenzyme F420:L-glutamate ligase [Methanosarcinales archaeon ANME-2c ERB4]
MHFNAFTVPDIPLVKEGDDLAEIICKNVRLCDRDIVVIASTVVAKAEGRVTELAAIVPSDRAITIAERNESDSRLVQAVLDESEEIIMESPFLLVKTRNGNICVNAGIDGSNIDSGRIILLPEDSDRSAKNIREDICSMTNKIVSVIITDTNGRAFRDGQIGVAIGISGITPTWDWRGSCDLFGNVLEVANEAVVDEIAAAANLLFGEGSDGTPAVVIRGLDFYAEAEGIRDLYFLESEDLVRDALVRG